MSSPVPPLAALDFLSPWPGWLWLALLAGSGLYVSALYRREGGVEQAGTRAALAALRLALLAILFGALAEPVWVVEQVDPGTRTVAVLVDESESMSIADEPDGKGGTRARIEAVKAFLADGRWLSAIPGSPRLRVLGFSERTRLVAEGTAGRLQAPPAGDEPRSPESGPRHDGIGALGAESRATALGDALRAALAQDAEATLAAVVVFTDGRSNRGVDPLTAAQAAEARGVRIFPIGVGDPLGARDVEVSSFVANDVALLNDQVRFTARLRSARAAGETAAVVLLEDGREAARKEARLSDGVAEVRFVHKASRPGRIEYRVVAEPLAGEVSRENNEARRFVEVVDAKLRVLLLDGYPRWEFQYLRNALKRDPVAAVSVLQGDADAGFFPEGTLPVRHVPSTLAEIGEYDAIVVGDVEPAFFPPGAMEALHRFVEDRAGGVVFVAGSRHRAPQCFRETPLEKLLPAALFDAAEEREIARTLPAAWSAELAWRQTPEGSAGEVAQIADEPEGAAELWASLPGCFWRAPLKRLKPLAATLLEGIPREGKGEAAPLLAYHRAGAGRVALLLTDETWRWRAGVDDLRFYRFWGGLLRDVSRNRLYGRSRRFWLDTGRREFAVGDAIPLRAEIYDADGSPVPWESAEALLARGESEPARIRLERDPVQPGAFSGSHAATEPGTYAFSLQADGRSVASATCEVSVPRVEFAATSLDEEGLKALAKRGDGTYRRLAEAADVSALSLPPLAKVTRKETPLWNHWLAYAAVVGLLTLEWIGRRMHRAL